MQGPVAICVLLVAAASSALPSDRSFVIVEDGDEARVEGSLRRYFQDLEPVRGVPRERRQAVESEPSEEAEPSQTTTQSTTSQPASTQPASTQPATTQPTQGFVPPSFPIVLPIDTPVAVVTGPVNPQNLVAGNSSARCGFGGGFGGFGGFNPGFFNPGFFNPGFVNSGVNPANPNVVLNPGSAGVGFSAQFPGFFPGRASRPVSPMMSPMMMPMMGR